MIMRSRAAMLSLSVLLGGAIAAPDAWAANITRGGQPAELTVTTGGAHSVRVTLKPVGMALPPSPSLLTLEIKSPAISLRTIERPVQARVGALDVTITPAPLTVLVKGAAGREIQKLVFDDKTGNVSFNVCDAPVLGLGEGGQQPGRGSGPMGVQFDRRGKLDVMRPGWGSGTLGSRNPIAVLVGTDGWGLFVASPWVQVDLRDQAKGVFIPTNNVRPTAGVENPAPRGGRGGAATAAVPAAPTPTPVPAESQGFDVFVFDAGEPANMMKDLRDLTGAPAMPPRWALGYMQSHRELRDAKMTPKELILNVVDTFRKKQIPVDSVAYLGTGFTPTGWNTPQPSFEFNPAVFSSDPPAGTWYDWWDNSRHNGGTTVKRRIDLATMPIYVRAGSIIPFDPVRQYMAQPVTEPTTFKVYSGANGEFTLYEDDGNSQKYMRNKGTWTKLTWDDGAKKLTITAAPPAGVTNESTTPRIFKVEMLPAGAVKTVSYNGRQAEVTF